jgi:hypothetical protein
VHYLIIFKKVSGRYNAPSSLRKPVKVSINGYNRDGSKFSASKVEREGERARESERARAREIEREIKR